MKFIRFNLLSVAVLLLQYLFVPLSSGQPPQDLKVVQAEACVSYDKIHPGGTFQVAIVADIKQGFHINSHKPMNQFLMPTVVRFDERKEIAFGHVRYPESELKSFSFSAEKLSVYKGRIVMLAQGKLSEDISLGDTKASGLLAYQACNDQSCFMPRTVKFEIPLKIVRAGEPVKLINKDIFQQEASLAGRVHRPREIADNKRLPFTSDELRAKELIERGLPYALLAFFLFGLALNLTPCVYPVIPMTVSLFVGQGEGKKREMFILSLFYVVGIALIFSVLGLISGIAGKQWGFLFQHPWFVIIIVIIILSMAASMFGAFEITIPSSLMTKFGKSRKGAIGSFIMGLTVGVVIAPCATGIIIGLVGVVAKLGIVAKGALLFFVMGLGLGLPYLFLATFSGLLNRLPKSGMWMVWVRKLFGLLLIGVALYFLVPQAKQIHNQQGFYLGILGIFGGLLLGFLEHGKGHTRGFKIIRGFFCVLLILSGVLLVNAAIRPGPQEIDWVYYKGQSIEQIQKENKPILVDFYADWCAVCKELDRKTFADKRVVEKSTKFIMARVDCTSPDNNCTPLTEKFNVSGLPTIVFISAGGEQLHNLRAVGFLGPDEMLKRMEKALVK
ncbi:MAG: thioredoxin family protein [Desulfobacterales bacterium]|nr:thioredoxin family protein [Desulfobacterales bacterium]